MNRILILGAKGMLGHTLFHSLSSRSGMLVYASARSRNGLDQWFGPDLLNRIVAPVEAEDIDSIINVLSGIRPDVVINCIGIIKQLPMANNPIISLTINSLFPHRLAQACKVVNARLIHISTDCVFRGDKGNYTEDDPSDALDLYGRTKYLGELYYPHCVTLRTSIIGHELSGSVGLIDWFLSQTGKVKGYAKAIYTGFSTLELARIIAEYVIPNYDLSGLYQVASDPISKYDLLKLVADIYGHRIEIERDEAFLCDRSLNGARFCNVTGYIPPTWPEMIENMHIGYKNKLT